MARWLVSLLARWWGEPCRGTKRVYLEKRRLAIAIVARQPVKCASGGGNFSCVPGGVRVEGVVRIEARTGRENSGLRERRDNGSNELTRTPEPRSSLSCQILSLSHLYHFPDSSHLFSSIPLTTTAMSHPLHPLTNRPALLLYSYPLFSSTLPTP